MKFDFAKKMLLKEGYRILEEVDDDINVEDNASDIYTSVEDGLGDEGFDATEIAEIMTENGERIEELANKGYEIEDIVKIIAYENCDDCETEEGLSDEDEIPADLPTDISDEEFGLEESRSKQKSDKFAHKQKVAGKKKKCEDCDDDDEELDESIEPDDGWEESNKKYGSISELYDVLIGRGYNFKSARDWVDANMDKIVMLKRKGYTAEDIVYELDGDLAGDMDESYEDVPGLIRGPRGQVGRDDWSDFKDDFRKKTLFLKKTLTPQFVSGIIKDTDFEVDEKDIKEYAIKFIEDVFDTKDPVRNLQARIRKFFVG